MSNIFGHITLRLPVFSYHKIKKQQTTTRSPRKKKKKQQRKPDSGERTVLSQKERAIIAFAQHISDEAATALQPSSLTISGRQLKVQPRYHTARRV